MNYYELYGFEPGLIIDKALLKQRYYELSRRYHPDFYKPGPGETADALELSSAVNKAYAIFQQPDATIYYLLRLNGLIADDEKYSLPPAFLARVMELNEQLMELEMEPDAALLAQSGQDAQHLLQGIESEVAPYIENYRQAAGHPEQLLPVKEYYYKKKYLQRIQDKLAALQKAAQ